MTEYEDESATPNGDPTDRELLARYVAGVAATAERSAVEGRLRTDASLRSELDRITFLWERTGSALRAPVTAYEVDKAWRRLAAEIDLSPRNTGRAGATRAPTTLHRMTAPPSTFRLRWRRATLIALVTMSTGIAIWGVGRVVAPPLEVATAPMREIVAPAGQRLSAALDDGTRITLAPGSRLRVPESFEGATREIQLEGRAYFEVAEDPDRPFLVHVDGAVTRVIGTEFEVLAFSDAPTGVVVRSGQVEVRSTSDSDGAARLLGVGDRAEVGSDGSVEVESGVDVDALLAWTEGTLAFRGAPFARVVPELERWFDLTVRLDDPAIGERRLTATFTDEPLDVVLETLAELVGASVERDGRQVVFSPLRAG